jgi:hypothetical protein
LQRELTQTWAPTISESLAAADCLINTLLTFLANLTFCNRRLWERHATRNEMKVLLCYISHGNFQESQYCTVDLSCAFLLIFSYTSVCFEFASHKPCSFFVCVQARSSFHTLCKLIFTEILVNPLLITSNKQNHQDDFEGTKNIYTWWTIW